MDVNGIIKGMGLKAKDPHVSTMMLRQDAPGTFRAMCFEEMPHEFDVFGEMKEADEFGECAVVQRCMEHINVCSLKATRKPEETTVLQNNQTPGIYLLRVRWAA